MFENKVVLITGAGSGMGAATAMLFAEKGANIVIVDLNVEGANETAEKCKEFGKKVLVVKADVSKDEEAKNVIEETINTFGKLDVLVNNAGIIRKGQLLTGNIMDTYDLLMNNNLRSVVLMTSLATPYLIKTKGNIVNNSSIASHAMHVGVPIPIYTVSKAGVDMFARLTAAELAASGVRANVVCPGPVYTNVLKNSGLDGLKTDDFIDSTALKRISEPHEVAELIVYLASDTAKSITGSVIYIDNGMTLL